MDWQGTAARLIATVHASLPETASLAERKKACRGAGGWQFHGGTSWGKKVWAKHTRLYLEKYGLPPLREKREPTFGSDICFPFRGNSDPKLSSSPAPNRITENGDQHGG